MKKLILITIISILSFQSYNAYSVTIGTQVAGIPSVSFSNADMLNQLNAFSTYGFTNISLVSMQLNYVTASSADFVYTFSFNPPGSSDLYFAKASLNCNYNSGTNEYIANVNVEKFVCISINCQACGPAGPDSCTPCLSNPEDDPIGMCKYKSLITSTFSWGADFLISFASVESWLRS